MKAAVYAGTRNVYQDMIPSMKSLLIHSDVDKIYFLIEDDEFPYSLPPEVECINVSGQTWFPSDGPNMKNRCSYMVLLRVVFSKIFPDLDRILTIDNDTIINENISDLWNLPIDNYYIAGCSEYRKTTKNFIYINMGLALMNLKKIREDKIDNLLVNNLNHYYYHEAEQSAINQACQGHILEISSDYNSNNYTKNNNKKEKIIHFAATKGWQNFPIIEKYRNIKITDRNIPDNFDLDIIIPYYNDVEGLEITLKSLCYPDLNRIHITVVNDCSDKNLEEYEELKNAFSNVQFIDLEYNRGPGAARQVGIDNTHSPYLMFIDTGDYIISKICLRDILETIENKSKYFIFSWDWINEENNHYFHNEEELLHGKVFKREFLELHQLRFNTIPEASYSNEDRGLLNSCNLILKNIKHFEDTSHKFISELPIYYRTFNKNSITKKDNENFFHTKHIQGTVFNCEHMMKICQKNNVTPVYIAYKITEIMVDLYYYYLKCAKEKPEYCMENLKVLKYFYYNVYSVYEKINFRMLDQLYSKQIKRLLPLISLQEPRINIHNFIKRLGEE